MYNIPSGNQTWRAGKYMKIHDEFGDVPIETPLNRVDFQLRSYKAETTGCISHSWSISHSENGVDPAKRSAHDMYRESTLQNLQNH